MKIGRKIRWSYWIILVIVFSVIAVSFQIFSERYLLNQARKDLRSDASSVSEVLSNVPIKKEAVRLRVVEKRMETAGQLLGSRILVRDKQKQVIFTNLTEKEAASFQQKQDQYVAETLPIYNKKSVIKGYVTLITKVENIQALKTIMRKTQMIGWVIAAIAAILMGLYLERSITLPIQKLRSHMQQFQIKGTYRPLNLTSKDEIADLAESFSGLAEKIKQYDRQQKDFLQNASHELKTPLMGIQGNAEGIMDGVIEGEEVKQSLETIIAESQRLKKIVEELSLLLMLENVEEIYHFKEIRLVTLLEQVVTSLRPVGENKGIHIFVKDGPDVKMMADADRIKQALHNILGNALRYAESEITISWSTKSRWLILSVEDDGKGLVNGTEQEVFERFYKGNNGGTGIGLAISKVIIEAHGGTVSAQNTNTRGAVFILSLPMI
ncbi:sensor histidine kinase [Fictibacillus fluitans]|uniref:histidine kinase n=1 Tax=Fictibacillus fluitans TaxID=3058422 RepID=A0ABT8HS63_9BACL|nr:HAMP domain-containing sensor histidine kinase [Fictibacillus sp. NE201]MDN4523325.1 HAMP domain-containing sensor histidine kinase [Fictibacillus sp. NE201]